jgi:hypothetical protein
VFANIYLDGIFNLPTAKTGKVLAFLPTTDPGGFAAREIRVWSKPDLAQLGSWVNASTSTGGGFFMTNTYSFYIDLGSVMYMDGIWLILT